MRQHKSQAPGRSRGWHLAALLAAVLLLAVPGDPSLASGPAPGSLEEAVAQVERAHSGRILSARAERRNGRVVYVIRLLTEDQQVRNFEIEGAEGARP